MSEIDLESLREELDEFAQPEKAGGRSAREERIVAGFEEIQQFVERHGRAPRHGEDRDIFERLYAVRLDRLRALEECRTLLAPLDHGGLLSGEGAERAGAVDSIDIDELRAELEGAAGPSAITELRHVRPKAEVRAADEVASRERCKDFDRFRPLFEQTQDGIKSGARRTMPFDTDASVRAGDFFILGGQLVYVAEMGEIYRTPNGEPNARLRVIYSNGTESDLLLRSLQRALYKDEAGRRVTLPSAGPLFGQTWEADDIESGVVYVLRTLSEHPFVAEHRALIHKIGVTGGRVEARIANAAHDATYLLADVEVVAKYKLANINRTRFENIIHRVFAAAQLDLTIEDRFGNPVRPREWFLVPLHAIDEAIERMRDGSITNCVYDAATARLIERVQ